MDEILIILQVNMAKTIYIKNPQLQKCLDLYLVITIVKSQIIRLLILRYY